MLNYCRGVVSMLKSASVVEGSSSKSPKGRPRSVPLRAPSAAMRQLPRRRSQESYSPQFHTQYELITTLASPMGKLSRQRLMGSRGAHEAALSKKTSGKINFRRYNFAFSIKNPSDTLQSTKQRRGVEVIIKVVRAANGNVN